MLLLSGVFAGFSLVASIMFGNFFLIYFLLVQVKVDVVIFAIDCHLQVLRIVGMELIISLI